RGQAEEQERGVQSGEQAEPAGDEERHAQECAVDRRPVTGGGPEPLACWPEGRSHTFHRSPRLRGRAGSASPVTQRLRGYRGVVNPVGFWEVAPLNRVRSARRI